MKTDEQTPKTWGREAAPFRQQGGPGQREKAICPPHPQTPQAWGFQNWPHGDFWGRVAARLGRNGGQEAQHHKMAPPKVGAGTKQSGTQSLRKEPDSGRTKGPGVRSLPELSMVVSSTAAVGYARDPRHLLIHLLLGPFRWSLTGSEAGSMKAGPVWGPQLRRNWSGCSPSALTPTGRQRVIE